MTLKTRLSTALGAIVTELEKSGKKGTANFFWSTRDHVETECDGNRSELLDLLKHLKSSSAITQYGNFSAIECGLWDEVYESASEWLHSFEP